MTAGELFGAGYPDLDRILYLGLIVVPMGWTSAIGVIQHVHRRLARLSGLPRSFEVRRARPLRQAAQLLTARGEFNEFTGEALMSLWQIYVDNLDLMELVDAREFANLVQQTMRRL